MTLLPDDRYPADLRRGRNQFCPLALEDWIEAAQEANVPAVGATKVAVFERDDILKHEYKGPHQPRLDAAYEQVVKATLPQTMMRWDCCASANLKMEMGDGNQNPDDTVRNTLPIDARILEIAYEYPRVLIPVWRRPWLGADEALWYEGYPVEYRAFVMNGAIQGISSYYPQRALRDRYEEIHEVRRLTTALRKALAGPFEWPASRYETMGIRAHQSHTESETADKKRTKAPKSPDPKGVHFTADFLVTQRDVQFLEGGPPHFMGAHPCCFEGRTIKGVALRRRQKQKSREDG